MPQKRRGLLQPFFLITCNSPQGHKDASVGWRQVNKAEEIHFLQQVRLPVHTWVNLA